MRLLLPCLGVFEGCESCEKLFSFVSSAFHARVALASFCHLVAALGGANAGAAVRYRRGGGRALADLRFGANNHVLVRVGVGRGVGLRVARFLDPGTSLAAPLFC